MMTNKQLAVGYCRVSTGTQDISLEAQEEQIRAMAVVKGLDLMDVIVDRDEFSGNLNRAGMQRVLKLIRNREVETVIIAKLDRFTRKLRDLLDLMDLMNDKGVALVSLSESLDTKSPMGRFFVRMMASLGELEREAIGARTRTAMAHMRTKGLPVGPAPYGYRAPAKNRHVPHDQKKTLVVDKEEQKIVKHIVHLREKDQLSLRRIASRLNREGITTRAGTPWRHQYIDALLRRQRA